MKRVFCISTLSICVAIALLILTRPVVKLEDQVAGKKIDLAELTDHSSNSLADAMITSPKGLVRVTTDPMKVMNTPVDSTNNLSRELVKERSIDQKYQFPVLPGSLEWRERIDQETPWALCQIPREILTNLTTSALIQTCVDYPMRGDILLFDSYQQGLDITISSFNGLKELMNREDAAALLKSEVMSFPLEKLQLAPSEVTEENANGNRAGYVDFAFETALLQRNEILEKLSAIELNTLCDWSLRSQVELRRLASEFSGSEVALAELAAKLLHTGATVMTHDGLLRYEDILGDLGKFGSRLDAEQINTLHTIGTKLTDK